MQSTFGDMTQCHRTVPVVLSLIYSNPVLWMKNKIPEREKKRIIGMKFGKYLPPITEYHREENHDVGRTSATYKEKVKRV